MTSHKPRSIEAQLEQQQTPDWHIPDQVRLGVLAGLEEYETWFQAHLLRCDTCRRPIIDLLAQTQGTEVFSDEGAGTCAQTRNALMHYLETGRPPPLTLLQHILICESCSHAFYEPAMAAVVLEFDPDEVGEAG